MQSVLTALFLPPLLLVLLGLWGGLLAWHGRRRSGGALAALAAAGTLLLATPFVSGNLLASLEREVAARPAEGPPPAAIIVLGGDAARGQEGPEIGAFTLERLRAGAALHRRTGLPLLVTGGPVGPERVPLAALMARSLREDFGVEVRWVEPRAHDTRDNAVFAAAILREAGIGSALVVTHGWHLPRAMEAFGRIGFPVYPAPLRASQGWATAGRWSDWVPRADHLGDSWYALREWAGRAVYALRDGG
ncbi:YdcF family protein [Roseomonas sp. BN140053]|uniref:YdcF family protein n=1 Tax=Roseomonas sp. BN140053 TaxID=3391898 RepID=UPI0039E9088A